MKLTDRKLAAGMKIPWWQRIAYYDINQQVSIVYPVGTHLIIRWAVRLWQWSFRYRKSRLETMMKDAYYKGWGAGRESLSDHRKDN